MAGATDFAWKFCARIQLSPLAKGASAQMRKLLFILVTGAAIHCACGGEPEAPCGQDTLTGTWGGLRPRLAEQGLTFSGSYIGEYLVNTRGGLRRGGEYSGLLELGFDVDFEKLACLHGASLHITSYYPHGGNIAQKFTGDLGDVSNIEAYDSFRVYEAWLEQKFLNDRAAIRVGLMGVDIDFAVIETSAIFNNSSFGAPAAVTLNLPIPSYPVSALGALLRIEPSKNSYFQIAAYDGNPAPGIFEDPTPGAATSNDLNKHNTRIALRHDEGAMFMAEIGWRTPKPDCHEKNAPLATSLKLGGSWHTDRFADIRDTTRGLPRPRSYRGNAAIYFIVEQDVWREPGTVNDGLTAFFRAAFAPADRNFFSTTAETGLAYRGIFQSDARDTLALGFEFLDISPRVAAAQRSIGVRTQDYEAIIELTYQRALTPWCSIQPDIQYVIHPGGSSELGNALVVGLRTTITF